MRFQGRTTFYIKTLAESTRAKSVTNMMRRGRPSPGSLKRLTMIFPSPVGSLEDPPHIGRGEYCHGNSSNNARRKCCKTTARKYAVCSAQSGTRTGQESRAIEFLYLDQEAVLAADLLDMPRAMDVVGRAHALFAIGEVRHPHKVVLRQRDTAESEEQGRFNALFAAIGGPMRTTGMKWIGSFPANRERGLPRASALIILNCPDTGMPVAVMDGTLISAMRTGAMTALGVRYPGAAEYSQDRRGWSRGSVQHPDSRSVFGRSGGRRDRLG